MFFRVPILVVLKGNQKEHLFVLGGSSNIVSFFWGGRGCGSLKEDTPSCPKALQSPAGETGKKV